MKVVRIPTPAEATRAKEGGELTFNEGALVMNHDERCRASTRRVHTKCEPMKTFDSRVIIGKNTEVDTVVRRTRTIPHNGARLKHNGHSPDGRTGWPAYEKEWSHRSDPESLPGGLQ